MHCDDVTRELSAPTGEPDPAALAEHLAGCPRCASWAERSARLDQLWEATRLPEPSPAVWNQVWANVSEALDRPAVPAAPRRWRRVALTAFTVAQAAAILAAFTLAWRESVHRHSAPRGPAMLASAVPIVPTRVEIEPGQPVRIDLDRRESHQLDQAQFDSPNSVDPFYKMFNEMESRAGTL